MEINIKKICNTKRLLEKYHYGATIVDTHIDTLMSAVDKNTYLPLNSMTNTHTEVNVEKVVKGGLDIAIGQIEEAYSLNKDNAIE